MNKLTLMITVVVAALITGCKSGNNDNNKTERTEDLQAKNSCKAFGWTPTRRTWCSK